MFLWALAHATEPVDITDVGLEDLLTEDSVGGAEGSFGYRLQKFGVVPFVHAYAVVDIDGETGKPMTFDLHYFNVFVGAEIREVVVPEVQLEYEHGGDEIQMRYGQIDVRTPTDLLTFRAGKFLVPFGTYNTQTYPEFLSPLPDRPLAMREIVPTSWGEVGAQIRGRANASEELSVGYALYIVNGLEQTDADPEDGVVQEGAADVRGMRNNHQDKANSAKSYGGRLGLQSGRALEFGVSGYVGRYTVEEARTMMMFGADLTAHVGPVRFMSEGVVGRYERTDDTRTSIGAYGLVGVTVTDWLEPVAQYDFIDHGDLDDQRSRYTLGAIVRPFPENARNLVLKGSGALTDDGSGDLHWRGIGQLAVGF